MYLTNLFVETLPSFQKSDGMLKKYDVDEYSCYVPVQLLLSRSMKNHIHSLSDEEATEWKLDFHQRIEGVFSDPQIDVLGLLNLQPIVRTVVLGIHFSEDVELGRDEIYQFLQGKFKALNELIRETYGTRLIGCFGPVVDNFFLLNKSYKKSRELQEYHYIIGMGNCSFYDIYMPEDNTSIVEYKYLHHFEELLDKEEWINIYDVVNTILDTVKENKVNDSKTMYIYKELFSMTIRYLFRQPTKFKEEIEVLNQGIIRFEHLFDDVSEINEYLLDILNKISGLLVPQGMNPHIKKTLAMIQTRYHTPLSLDEIARELNLSHEYLSRLFKIELGYNFKTYITDIRINKAKELLSTTGSEVKEIREMVGYQSPTQFVRAFKKKEGMTPSKYRVLSKK